MKERQIVINVSASPIEPFLATFAKLVASKLVEENVSFPDVPPNLTLPEMTDLLDRFGGVLEVVFTMVCHDMAAVGVLTQLSDEEARSMDSVPIIKPKPNRSMN